MNQTNIIKTIETNGFIEIDYPDRLKKVIIRSFVNWKNFCALSKEIKEKFIFEKNGGYEKRIKKNNYDNKETFHTSIPGIKRFDRMKLLKNQTACLFLSDASTILKEVLPILENFTKQVEETFIIKKILSDIKKYPDCLSIRYIHYLPGNNISDIIGQPHVDKGGFTLHLFEDCDGVEYLWKNLWYPFPLNKNKTVLFGGLQLQLITKNSVKALCHRILATKKSTESGRYSIVLFTNFPSKPYYNKSVYGRSQNFPAGFNYTISFSEFAKMFTRSKKMSAHEIS